MHRRSLVYSILNQTLGPREAKKGWRGAFGWLSGLASPRFAYSAVSVAATLLILLMASGISLRKPKLADLAPSNVYRNVDGQAHRAYARTTKFVSDLRVVYEIQSRLNKDNEFPRRQRAPSRNLLLEKPRAAPTALSQRLRASKIVPMASAENLKSLQRKFRSSVAKLCGQLLGRRIP